MDKFFVNPGSATGAFLNGWGDDGEGSTPSFCLMDVGVFFFYEGGQEYGGMGFANDDLSRFKEFPSHCTFTS